MQYLSWWYPYLSLNLTSLSYQFYPQVSSTPYLLEELGDVVQHRKEFLSLFVSLKPDYNILFLLISLNHVSKRAWEDSG